MRSWGYGSDGELIGEIDDEEAIGERSDGRRRGEINGKEADG